jgi:hypothetical protein
MISKKKTQKYFLSVSIMVLLVPAVFSQDNTLFYLQGAPQRYFINPASQPECNFFFGTPGLSSTALTTVALLPINF